MTDLRALRAPIPIRPKICRAIIGGERCTEAGVYRTWVQDCEACRIELGALSCAGHTFCVEHAAELRTGTSQFEYNDAFVVVTRMTGIAA